MEKISVQLTLINSVMSNVIRRITGSVNEFFPITTDSQGKYNMTTVMATADQEYEMQKEEMSDPSLDESDKKIVLDAVYRDLLPVIRRFNKE